MRINHTVAITLTFSLAEVSTEDDASEAYFRFLVNKADGVGRQNRDKTALYSVRCIKD